METVTFTNHYYGREGELTKLNKVRTDWTKSPFIRSSADRAYKKIVAQCEDKVLMALRERLIRASQAGDREAIAHISGAMKIHSGEDPETGY